MNTAFVYTDKYFDFDYGPSHPLRIERLRLTRELCRAYGLLDLPGVSLVETEVALEKAVLGFHTAAYVNALKRASRGRLSGYYTHGIGPGDNPMFDGLWEWSLLHTGASLQCVDRILEGACRTAFNIAGGLHHAASYRASGFCYVNDPVIAIQRLIDRGRRVLYLDIDAHHGDGVQAAFYEDPRVLTVSFHQDGRTLFPGTGRLTETGREAGEGYSVNVPMMPGTDDEVFWSAFQAVMPSLTASFDPDVIVTQLGVDTFRDDPLADLELTTNSMCRVATFLRDLEKPWVALGGGGYDVDNVARAWTLAWAIMNGVDLPEELPEAMRGRIRGGGVGTLLRDPEHRSRRHDACARFMDASVDHLVQNVLPMAKRPLRIQP
jgi:acetoin utilization protein AcuC